MALGACIITGNIRVNGAASAATITATPVLPKKNGVTQTPPAGADVPAVKNITVPGTGIVPNNPTLDVPGPANTWPANIIYELAITASGKTVTQNYFLGARTKNIDLGVVDFTVPVAPGGGATTSASDLTTGTLLDSVIPAGIARDSETTAAVSAAVAALTKSSVGLGNVDNTADVNKPVSTSQQTALNAKADLASPAFTGTPTGITKAHIGLGNVDNTSDDNKPVSVATATALSAKSRVPDVQVFTTNGTWTKPAGISFAHVTVISGGGGGGSGRRTASGTASSGGGGGAGGGCSSAMFPAAVLGSTETVTVGAGGTAATAITVDSTNGNNGGNGGTSTFGSKLRANAGAGGTAGSTGAAAGGSGGAGVTSGGNGGAGAVGTAGVTGSSSNMGGAGGGSGGGLAATPAFLTGGIGGSVVALNSASGGAGGSLDGAAGSAGVSATGFAIGGSGGGGGASSVVAAGGNGGAGGNYGAGGGGGGDSLNGFNSGAGGAGAPGIVVVVSQ